MAIRNEKNVLVATAGQDFTAAHEGCLVTVLDPLTTSATAKLGAVEGGICGVLLHTGLAGQPVEVALAGQPGIIEARASASYTDIKPGVAVAANTAGTFKLAAAGDVVIGAAVTAPTASGALFDIVMSNAPALAAESTTD